jgi:Zn-finger nucleic acid-binding protein
MRATSSGPGHLCDRCEGLWLDWFDGEVHVIAASQEAARVERGTPLPQRSSLPPLGSAPCPRCTMPLGVELYRFPDATDDELITGVELLRCPECAGAFVPRGSAHLLLQREREPRTQSPMTAILALVRGTFGRRP